MSQTINIQLESKYLVDKAKGNDRLAQKQLYEAYSPAMLSVCRLYINDLHFAEDVLLKAFFKIFTNLKSYSEENHLYAWMRKIVVNECIDFLRSKTQKITFSDWDDTYDSLDDISSEGLFVEEQIQSFIDELPEGCRMVFNLYVFEDYGHQQIAEELDISVGTSKSQLAYAKKILKAKLIKENYDYAK